MMVWRIRKCRVRSFRADAAAYGPLASRAMGTRAVPVKQIVGSVGRAHELRSDFLSFREGDTDFRYLRVREIMRGDGCLPPVDLYLLEGKYYVVDGNHRVAAARSIGQVYLDAIVTEFRPAQDAIRAA
jgi:hypothetical protein